MPTNVLLTGAFGRVGSALIEHLADRDDYAFTYLDREPHPDHDAHVADVADYDAVSEAMTGQDAVVHLAGNPHPSAPWDDVLSSNVIGTYNVLDAACEAGVERVTFASTNHTMGMHRADAEPELYDDPRVLVDHESEPRPNSYYAVSKLFGEHLGRYYVECEDAPERFYALRIGWVLDAEADSPYGPAERRHERGTEEYEHLVDVCKGMWCSRRDIAHLVDCTLTDESVAFDVFYGRSAGSAGWLDIDHAREVLGYEPRDDADEWEGPR